MNILKITTILLLGIAIFSCNEKKDEGIFLKCFNEKEQGQLTQLKFSFDNFLKNNYEGSRMGFLKELRKSELDEKFIFEKTDTLLFEKLHKQWFIKKIACFYK